MEESNRPTESQETRVGRSLCTRLPDLSREVVAQIFAGEPDAFIEAVEFLTRCRACGQRLSTDERQNVAILLQPGPLILHVACADALRLTIQDRLYREST